MIYLSSTIGFGEAFVSLFTFFPLTAFVLLVVGVLLVLIEMFRYAKNIFLITGGILLFAGVLLSVIAFPHPATIFFLLLFLAAILLVADLFRLRLQKRGWLFQALRLAVSEETEFAETYEFLADAFGIAITNIEKTGKIEINDIAFSVFSDKFIPQGAVVQIEAVDGEKIFVKMVE